MDLRELSENLYKPPTAADVPLRYENRNFDDVIRFLLSVDAIMACENDDDLFEEVGNVVHVYIYTPLLAVLLEMNDSQLRSRFISYQFVATQQHDWVKTNTPMMFGEAAFHVTSVIHAIADLHSPASFTTTAQFNATAFNQYCQLRWRDIGVGPEDRHENMSTAEDWLEVVFWPLRVPQDHAPELAEVAPQQHQDEIEDLFWDPEDEEYIRQWVKIVFDFCSGFHDL